MFNNKIENKWNNNTFIQIQNNVFNLFNVQNIKWFLKDINWREKEVKLLDENFYVPLNFEDSKKKNDIFKDNKIIVIWNPGSWKTQFMVDSFCYIKNNLNKKLWLYYNNEFLPLFIALRDLKDINLSKFINDIRVSYNLKGEQKFILLLDWLDEISLDKIKEILDFIESNQNYKYIISSRKTSINLGELLSKYPEFLEYKIKEFNFNVNNGWNTQILEKYFNDRWKTIDLEKYKKLQIEIKDVFYLEQYFEVYEQLDETDWKLELTEKFLNKISNKNNQLLNLKIEKNEVFNLLTKISEFLYKNNSLILEKEDIQQIISNLRVQENEKKDILEYLLTTFFIKSEWNYSFYHKTFYEYFLIRYISKEYSKNKLSIREWNILLDKEFMFKIFFPYVKNQYLKDKKYSWIISLNLFMTYYLRDNPIDEINPEIFIKWLFNLPEESVREYIFETTSPIYDWFDNFYYLNFNTINIALNNWYNDIADYFYKKLNILIKENSIEKKKIKEKYWRLDKNDKDFNSKKHDLNQEYRDLDNWLDFKNRAYIRILKDSSLTFYKIYKLVNNKYSLNIYQNIDLTTHFYDSPYYTFFDDLLKYSEEKEIIKILKELEKIEFYAFLQVWLKLENIKNILWNENILELIKDKFIFHKWDFKEFINYDAKNLKINDSAITLFLKYIFWLYKDNKEIFDSQDFSELKEWHNWFFDNRWWFYKSNLNNSQLASYLFYYQIDLQNIVEKQYKIWKWIIKKASPWIENWYYNKRCIYQYSYSIFINSIINNSDINFKNYIEKIKKYSLLKSDDSLNIKIIYAEILAYIFYYNVNWDYFDSINLIWDNLEEFIDKIIFYKTIQILDDSNQTKKLREIINKDRIDILSKDVVKVFDYPAYEVEDYIFISQLYWLNLNKDLQVKNFNKWIAHSYIKYWYRKDYYLTVVFEILEELKDGLIITEQETFKYLDEIVELYWIIDWITEKWVAYLWKNIINFILTFSVDKAEEYNSKIEDINYSYNDEIKTSILIQKIKNKSFKEDEIENIYFNDNRTSLLELKIYLYLVDNWREEFINKVNDCIEYVKKENSIDYYWSDEDSKLYEKLYNLWKINKSDLILKEVEKPKREKKEIISLKWLTDIEIINILNEKYTYWMYHTSFWWDYNYLLNELYLKDKNLLYKYISWTKFKFHKEDEYEFFANFQWMIKIYIKNKDNKKVIDLFEELLDFAKLIIV